MYERTLNCSLTLTFRTMEKYKYRIALSFGCLEICDFPSVATAFEQYPSGRLVIDDLHGDELIYYRLKISAAVRNRNSKLLSFEDYKAELYDEVHKYLNEVYGRKVSVYGMATMYRYLNWLLAPDGRHMRQRPGSRIEPINSSQGGYQIFIEFPNLVFFHMHDRVVCSHPTDPNAPPTTYYSRRYQELSTSDVNADTVAHAYPRDGFFGVMPFDGNNYFFSLQMADVPRWNTIARPDETGGVWNKDRLLSNSLSQEDIGIILHREILKRFSFFRHGTLGKPSDIQVLFNLTDRLNEKPAEYPNIRMIKPSATNNQQ